ncbi:predicted protein [Histoplasma capsulatum G186AR]|uniref:Uncharacterized protein n=1 Tax=Ajellomyces capsulatus (strain G186AR / H82 / ATCC MYA-2454 / RMSCC 2432) TaxID=447093 RepID=C0NEY6_AJECG|nr:uncharacterized protein HCBG_01452 [Histoplasma capsulatum G186AR]EEH09807.1 predicted protein [Histoplasma capsulatum G186AR]
MARTIRYGGLCKPGRARGMVWYGTVSYCSINQLAACLNPVKQGHMRTGGGDPIPAEWLSVGACTTSTHYIAAPKSQNSGRAALLAEHGVEFGYFGNSVMVLVILLDEFTVPQPVDPSSGYMVTNTERAVSSYLGA